tara:strand:- start:856 stop:6033 length:5178 start_codon:yes stop_codon:yes gene_type:complete
MAILTQTHNGLKFVGTGTSILNDNGQQIMRLIGTTRTNTKVGIGPQTPTTVFTVHDIQDTSYFSGIGIHRYEETYDGQQPHHFFNAVGGSLNLVADAVRDINIMQGQNGNHVAIFKHVGSEAYRMGLGTEDPAAKLHVVGTAKITGDLLLGEDGTTPKIDIMFEDETAGVGYDRRIHIGKSDDLPNSNSYPSYTGAGGYGIQFQSYSDGAYFGIRPYPNTTSTNYRPVINWGDDVADSPFAFQFNGTDVFKVTTSGKVAGTGHSWDAFRPQGLTGSEAVGSETNKLILSGGSINFKGSGGSGSTNLQIDGTTFLSSGLALTINSGTLNGNEIATLIDVYRTKANIGSHGTGRWRNSSNLYPEPAAELINAATGNPFNSGIVADSLMYKDVESYSYDGSAWADCSSETDFSGLLTPNSSHTWGGVNLERDQDDYIMYVGNQTGYGFHGWLLMMHSTNGNDFSYKIETTDTNPDTLAKKTEDVGGSTGWSVIDSNLGDDINSWPGYTIDKIYLRTGSSSDDYVRIRFTPSWDASYTTKITLGKIGMYASYGNFTKPASVDKDKFFKFNNGIGIGYVYGSDNHYINAHKDLPAGMFSTYRNDTGFVLNRSYADYGNDGTTIEYQERIGVDGNSASVGTFGAHKFSLRTSNTDALVVDTDGKIGINTASNSAEETNNGVPRLQVTTATAALGEFPLAARFTTASDAGNNSGVSVLINSGNDRGLMISAGREVENTAKVTLNVVNNDGDELDTITMKQSSAGASSAYVGIGTTSPSEKLEVAGNDISALIYDSTDMINDDESAILKLRHVASSESGDTFFSPSHPHAGINFEREWVAAGGTLSTLAKIHTYGETSWGGGLVFMTKPDDGSSSSDPVNVLDLTPDGEALFSGNVGIGTTSPDAPLSIHGAQELGIGASGLRVHRPDSFGQFGFFDYGQSSGTTYIGSSYTGGTAANYGEIRFRQLSNGGAVKDTMVISSDNKVGIGTASPQSKLHIETGSGGAYSPNINHDDVTIEGSGNIGLQLFSPNTSYQYIAFGDPDSVNAGYLRYYHGANQMVFRTNGSDNMIINSSGYVGIGEDNPAVPLHVSRDSASGENIALILDNNDTTAGNEIGMLFRSMVGSTNTDFEIFGKANASNDMDLVFQSDGSNERVRFASDGNVGIGTNDPRTALDFALVGNTSQVSNISLPVYNGPSGGDGTTIGSALQWYPHYGGYTKRSAGIAQIAEGNYFRSGLAFYTNNSETSTGDWAERIRINMDGDLGVGNTAPKEKLDVQGSIVLGREHGVSQLHNNVDFNKLTPGLIWREYNYTESPTTHATSSDTLSAKIKDHTTFTESGIATIVNGFTRSDDTYIVEFVGYYFAEEAGTHLFSVSADDSADMFIDGKRVAFWYGGHGDNSSATGGTLGSGNGTVQTPGSIYLEKGYHRIYTRFQENTGGDSINLWHQAPSDSAYEVIPAANLFHDAADRAMSTEHGVEFHEAVVSAKELTAFNGILNLDDDGTHDGVINAKASLTINIDADANSTGEAFRINKNTTAVNSTPLLQISESMVTRFNAQQDSGSRIELFNNRQDLSNVEVFRIASYNSVEASGIHFYRGGGGASGYATVYAKKNNASSLERVVKFGGDNTLDATFAADVIAYSDKRVKENIKTLDGKKVLDMRGVSFNRTDQDGRLSSGVIAQELEKVAPELVKDDGDLKAVAYGNLTGYLIEAIKDQQKQIDELKKLIKNGNNL